MPLAWVKAEMVPLPHHLSAHSPRSLMGSNKDVSLIEDEDDFDNDDDVDDQEQESIGQLETLTFDSSSKASGDNALGKESVHEFCARFKFETSEMIRNTYTISREMYCSPQSGSLSTSIAEDLITLMRVQNEVLQEYLSAKRRLLNIDNGQNDSDSVGWEHREQAIVIDLFRHILTQLEQTHQSMFVPLFLNTLEDCCAAANDFFRLSNKLEVFCASLWDGPDDDDDNAGEAACDFYYMTQDVRQQASNFVARLSQDAVYAAERIQVFFIRHINHKTNLPQNLFSPSWEQDWGHNEVMQELLQQLDLMFLPHVETWLENELLYQKVLVSSCKALVCLYIRCLVEKADAVCRRYKQRIRLPGRRVGANGRSAEPFSSGRRALLRMNDDIQLMRQYFVEQAMAKQNDDSTIGNNDDLYGSKAGKSNAALARILDQEMKMLEVILECLSVEDSDSLETMIVVLHKRCTGADPLVTKFFVGDLWSLVTTTEQSQEQVQNIVTNGSTVNSRYVSDQNRLVTFRNSHEYLRDVMLSLQPDLEMVSKGIQAQQEEQKGEEARQLFALVTSQKATISQLARPREDLNQSSFLRIDQMLKGIYEDRIAQGILPICWACLPKTEANNIGSDQMVTQKIRSFTRQVIELNPLQKKRSSPTNRKEAQMDREADKLL
mmetsp:Transcript_2841/g.6045  ORF Transcript_2841/g.6045 Transcript_2841/m.6045 type:complete len:664 (-) Transcript_2841:173-2164(-)